MVEAQTPVHLSYSELGTGTPLILLHGFPLNRAIWQSQVEQLAESARVITPDLRGHGASPAPEGEYSIELMARDVLTLLDELGIQKAIWAGHSMGGYVALAAYRIAPERFSGLALVATSDRADTAEGRQKRYELIEKVKEQGSEAAVNSKLFKSDVPEDTDFVQATEDIQKANRPEGIIGSLHAMANRPDSTELLKEITIPTLVIGGIGDQIFKREIAQEMAHALPDSILTLVCTGHMPMLEDPDAVTDALHQLIIRVENEIGE